MNEAELKAADDALYARNDNIRIGYRNRAGDIPALEEVITVRRDRYNGMFYAMGGKWGCGKNARDVDEAIRLLLQDMATLIWMQVEPEHKKD